MIIIHHNDADGRCAAFIAYACDNHKTEKVEFVEMNYGKNLPFEF